MHDLVVECPVHLTESNRDELRLLYADLKIPERTTIEFFGEVLGNLIRALKYGPVIMRLTTDVAVGAGALIFGGVVCLLVVGCKGLEHRFKAFASFLERYPENRGQVRFLQIATATRGNVPEYRALRQRLGAPQASAG